MPEYPAPAPMYMSLQAQCNGWNFSGSLYLYVRSSCSSIRELSLNADKTAYWTGLKQWRRFESQLGPEHAGSNGHAVGTWPCPHRGVYQCVSFVTRSGPS
jgi:hypothetical protein